MYGLARFAISARHAIIYARGSSLAISSTYKMFIAKHMFPRSEKAKAYVEAVPALVAEAGGTP